MQAHGVAAGAALEDFEEQQEAERSDEKLPKKRKKRLKPKPCPLDLVITVESYRRRLSERWSWNGKE